MTIDDAYATLGVPPGAADAEVKSAWRRLVSQWHPDRNASAEAAALIQRINGAYERIRLASVGLADDGNDGAADARRAHGAADAGEAEGDAGDTRDAGDPSGRRSGAPDGGRVVQRRVRLSLEEAALGCTRVLRGRLTDTCAACGGGGRHPSALRCTACQGAGRARSGWWFAWPGAAQPCDACEGRGTVRPPCPACEGAGRVVTRYQRTVRLPGGVRHGDRLVADGAGRHHGGFDGTLELRIEVQPHPFLVPGDDGQLRCEFPVDGFAWLAEAWVEVPTLSGEQQMRLRRGRLVYRLRGQGLPLARGSRTRGDYVVTVTPVFPPSLDAEQQALVERLAASADPAPALARWRQRLVAWKRSRGAAQGG